jgi:hypothetical protein
MRYHLPILTLLEGLVMFLQNKYSKYYFNIINSAKLRIISKNIYTERHHIIPKSLGGNNSKNNLVKLTAREHFICHWLLTKMTSDRDKIKMIAGLWMMSNVKNEYHQRYKINSRIYEIIRINAAKEFSKNLTGRKLSEETKKKISKTRKEKIKNGEITVNENKEKYKIISRKRIGKIHSEETKKKIGDSHRGKTISAQQKEYLSKLNTGKSVTKETKIKLSNTLKKQYASGERKSLAGMKGKKLSEDAKEKMRKPKARGWCPHCDTEGPLNSLKRYHYDNCKSKGNINGSTQS